MKANELDAILEGLAPFLRRHSGAIRAFTERLSAIESRQPERGEKGDPGSSVTLADVEPLIARAVAALPPAKDGAPGKDAPEVNPDFVVAEVLRQVPTPRDGKDAPPVDLQALAAEVLAKMPAPKDGAPGASVTVDDVAPLIERAVGERLALIPVPKDGAPGSKGDPGNSVTPEQLAPMVAAAVERAVSALPQPAAGKDGRDGVDGKSFTADEVRAMVAAAVESEQAKWALDFERRAQGVLERAVERMPRPKDGVDGKDGADGMGPDDVTIEFEDARTLAIKYAHGDVQRVARKQFPMPMYRGIYQAGDGYAPGDLCTFGGSLWHCNAPTTDKPGEGSPTWSLCAKRGRDGKSGDKGDPGKNGRDGTNGVHGKNWDGSRGPS